MPSSGIGAGKGSSSWAKAITPRRDQAESKIVGFEVTRRRPVPSVRAVKRPLSPGNRRRRPLGAHAGAP
jgi:hypothetical protein